MTRVAEPIYHEWPYEGYIEEDDTELKFKATITHTSDYLIESIEVYDSDWHDGKRYLTARAEMKAAAKFRQLHP